MRLGMLRVAGRAVLPQLAVFVVALAPRLGAVLDSPPGLRGAYPYDPGVYYAAADALIHGRAPYADFVLLHPPGITLAAAPFAWLGILTTDHQAFIVGNLAFTVLGALNAVLVVRVARGFGWGTPAALLGGLAYAIWPGAINAEYAIRLEPLGNFLVLCGLLAYARAGTSPQRRWAVLSGAAFGAAAAVKIWWAVPLVLAALWLLTPRRRAQLGRYVAGAAGALIAICGPFFAIAPSQMWQMVVTEQLGRPRLAGEAARLVGFTGLTWVDPSAVQHSTLILTIAAVLLAGFGAAALRSRGGPQVVSLLLAAVAVLEFAPSWYVSYDDFLAPGLALTVGAGVATVARALARRPVANRPLRWSATGLVGAVAAGVVAAVSADVVQPTVLTYPYPTRQLADAVDDAHCVMSDSPIGLIMMDALSRDLADGCANWVDVTGRTYGGPDATPQLTDGTYLPRADNARWQRDLANYLFSGDVFTLQRVANTGIGPTLWREIWAHPVLTEADKIVVFATHPTSRAAMDAHPDAR